MASADDRIRELFVLPLEEFTATRNRLAKELRDEGDRDRADRAGKARKPTVAAWALNRAARDEPALVEAMLKASDHLRDVQSRGARSAQLKEASAARRRAVEHLADAAKQAGIMANLDKARGDGNIAIGGGNTLVSTLDMASAYSTFAANGVYRKPHLVAKVLNPDGSEVWSPHDAEKQAFDSNPSKNAKIARNVTEALLPVPGYSHIPCADNRLCAGKTGTHQLDDTKDNEKAWMVGYTPQISTAVSMTSNPRGPIINAQGKIIFGSGLPGQIWKKFMDSYNKLYNLPNEDFGKFVAIGKGFQGDDESSNPNKPGNGNGNNQPTTTTTDRQGQDPTTTTTTPRGKPTRPTFPTTLPPNGGPQQPVP